MQNTERHRVVLCSGKQQFAHTQPHITECIHARISPTERINPNPTQPTPNQFPAQTTLKFNAMNFLNIKLKIRNHEKIEFERFSSQKQYYQHQCTPITIAWESLR